VLRKQAITNHVIERDVLNNNNMWFGMLYIIFINEIIVVGKIF